MQQYIVRLELRMTDLLINLTNLVLGAVLERHVDSLRRGVLLQSRITDRGGIEVC